MLELMALQDSYYPFDEMLQIMNCPAVTIQEPFQGINTSVHDPQEWMLVHDGYNYTLLLFSPFGTYKASYTCRDYVAPPRVEINWEIPNYNDDGTPLNIDNIAGYTFTMTVDNNLLQAMTVIGANEVCVTARTEPFGREQEVICTHPE